MLKYLAILTISVSMLTSCGCTSNSYHGDGGATQGPELEKRLYIPPRPTRVSYPDLLPIPPDPNPPTATSEVQQPEYVYRVYAQGQVWEMGKPPRYLYETFRMRGSCSVGDRQMIGIEGSSVIIFGDFAVEKIRKEKPSAPNPTD